MYYESNAKSPENTNRLNPSYDGGYRYKTVKRPTSYRKAAVVTALLFAFLLLTIFANAQTLEADTSKLDLTEKYLLQDDPVELSISSEAVSYTDLAEEFGVRPEFFLAYNQKQGQELKKVYTENDLIYIPYRVILWKDQLDEF